MLFFIVPTIVAALIWLIPEVWVIIPIFDLRDLTLLHRAHDGSCYVGAGRRRHMR